MSLVAPFPWFGGKRRWAPLVWERFGDVGVYSEPFAGSLAVLLHRETPAAREVVCDTDGGICNFFRAVRSDPEKVAHYADYPTIHQDLTARHRYLIRWLIENASRLEDDPDYFDARAAGWWVWGISLWIGSGWCQTTSSFEKRPHVKAHPGGSGISAQRRTMPTKPSDKIPYIGIKNGRRGVQETGRTRDDGRKRIEPTEKMPLVQPRGRAGKGVSAQRGARPDLIEWFNRLANRLHAVIVLNRGWESAVMPSVLQHTPTGPKPQVGIFIDPPYLQDGRSELYGSDAVGESNEVALASYAWALEHGDRYRIAYCCHDGDVDVPNDWSKTVKSFRGIKRPDRRSRQEMILFSPACFADRQKPLGF